MPKVSVIIPSYNHEKYVGESIQSVLDQTYQDFEIIIVDDCSTDGTVAVIKEFNDHRIKLSVLKKNQGACFAANKCLQKSSGQYIAMLSSDDVFFPDKLEKQVRFLDRFPEYGVVFGYAQIIYESGNDFDHINHKYGEIFKQNNKSRFEWLSHFFYKGNCLCHPSALIRKECYDKIGFYDERLASLPDLDFWVRICLEYNIYILPEELIKFRVRTGELNASGDRPETHIRNRVELLEILKNYLSIKNTDDFIKIFPETKRIKWIKKIEGSFIPFYLAMLALDAPFDYHHLFAIEILFELLKDRDMATMIERKTGFTYRDLIELTGRYDVFKIHGGKPSDQLPQILPNRNSTTYKFKITSRITTCFTPVYLYCALSKIIDRLRFICKKDRAMYSCLDSIVLFSNKVSVSGWVVSSKGIEGLERIEVYFDNHYIGNADYGLPRPDVEQIYSSIKDSKNSGFHMSADTSKLSQVANNKHKVLIKAIGIDGQSSKRLKLWMPKSVPN